MKILIGVLIILGLGWFLLGIEPETETVTDDANTPQETVDDGSMTDEPEEMQATGREVSFDITGEHFSFSMDEIHVSQGDTVTIHFESVEGFHDFVIDEFNAATERVNVGERSSVTFVASRLGEFEYYCSVGSHREEGMVGTLIVEPPGSNTVQDDQAISTPSDESPSEEDMTSTGEISTEEEGSDAAE
jgi:plastocyanin